MRLELTGRHVDITPALRRLVEGKLAKLERMLNDSALSAQAVLTREKHRHRAEITLHARGEKFLHSVGSTGSWEESLADAIDKLGHQVQKVKGKWQSRKRRGAKRSALEAAEGVPVDAGAPSARGRRERVRMPRIFRASKQTIKAMSLSDAAREAEADGDGIVVFLDIETASLSVLYRRRNGELTLVQTEA